MVQVAQIGGRGGGEVIRAMPKRKHFFFREGFPKCRCIYFEGASRCIFGNGRQKAEVCSMGGRRWSDWQKTLPRSRQCSMTMPSQCRSHTQSDPVQTRGLSLDFRINLYGTLDTSYVISDDCQCKYFKTKDIYLHGSAKLQKPWKNASIEKNEKVIGFVKGLSRWKQLQKMKTIVIFQ